MEQKRIYLDESYEPLIDELIQYKDSGLFLVCGNSIKNLELNKYLLSLEKDMKITRFSDFEPNPSYDSVVKGVQAFLDSKASTILAVGGGSAMDLAKCIKLFSNMNHNQDYLEQEIVPNDVKLIAIPTTAGTGSETTRYAVIYYRGEKQSITHVSSIPSVVMLDPSVLNSLPPYQKKATLLDALCHAMESYWSINSTDESKELSKKAIQMILENVDTYLDGNNEVNKTMLEASLIAGEAINITQTTAGHAMSYKLTGLYGMAHGQAVGLVNYYLWSFMVEHINQCNDSRGEEYLSLMYNDLVTIFGCNSTEEAIQKYQTIVDKMQFDLPKDVTEEQINILSTSVNPTRLKNNPIYLKDEDIVSLYRKMLGKKNES